MIVTPGSAPAALAAKQATATVPVVFATGGDPIGLGLVTSLSRPAGNVTGVASLNADLAAKRLAIVASLCRGRRIFRPRQPNLALDGELHEGALGRCRNTGHYDPRPARQHG